MPNVNHQQTSPLDQWKLGMAQVAHTPTILLCGAKQWPGSQQKDHRVHCLRAQWTATDIEAGPGVDLAFDLQTMWEWCERKWDGIFCPSVLEHIQRPWTAIHSMTQMLNPGGLLYIQTHQTFPLHGYPDDYFRFSTQALETMTTDSGLVTVLSSYENPCTITPSDEMVWNPIATAWLNVTICARKP